MKYALIYRLIYRLRLKVYLVVTMFHFCSLASNIYLDYFM